jgi:hypothetical protein
MLKLRFTPSLELPRVHSFRQTEGVEEASRGELAYSEIDNLELVIILTQSGPQRRLYSPGIVSGSKTTIFNADFDLIPEAKLLKPRATVANTKLIATARLSLDICKEL